MTRNSLLSIAMHSLPRFAMHLRVRDLNLGVRPARAYLRAEITKGKRARVAYMSEEAVGAIVEITNDASPDRFIFDYSGDVWGQEVSHTDAIVNLITVN